MTAYLAIVVAGMLLLIATSLEHISNTLDGILRKLKDRSK